MTQTATSDSVWSFEEAQAEFSRQLFEVRICFDGKLVNEIERLEQLLAEERDADEMRNLDKKAPAIARRLVELHEQLKAKERLFRLASIGGRWEDLKALHPPTDDQKEEGFDHNPTTFPVAAIHACTITPEVTLENVQWMRDHLAFGQFRRLWNTALAANVIGLDGVGKALSDTARALASEPSSTTAAPAASPGPSSLADAS